MPLFWIESFMALAGCALVAYLFGVKPQAKEPELESLRCQLAEVSARLARAEAENRRLVRVVDAGTGEPPRDSLAVDDEQPALCAEHQARDKELEARLHELDTANEELRWLTKELQTARDYAVSATRTKAQFLANMSHEIRTPLNGLIATSELLLQTQLEEEQQEFVIICRESAFALLETLNDLLDFSRMETDKLSLELADLNVVSLVEGSAEVLSGKARQKNLSLMTYVAHEVPRSLYGDPTRLRQVLSHLLSNAIKFTEHGEVVCRVTLESLTQARATVRFAVYDTGMGMPRAMQRSLFEPFAQADGSLTRPQAGSGLGLSIARRLVELMGGTIGVESTEGQGSTFWFVVPLENRAGPADELPHVPETLRNLRMLLVDGLPETQKVIQSYARSWNMTCSTAKTASDALAMMGRYSASHRPFDLVVVDFSVADMHPFTLARYIRNSADLCDTRLMLLTAGEEEGRGERALKCGYSAFLSKPIKQSQLFDCIATVMSGQPIFEPSGGPPGACDPDDTVQLPGDALYKPIVLVAEDNAVNQRVARLQLEELGCRVHVVSDGREAVEAAGRLRYDLILMDCAMPLVDGYEATSRIRKLETMIGRRTPIVALTAHSLPGDREKCLACGMDDYLSKPISKDDLGSALGRWMPHHGGRSPNNSPGKGCHPTTP